MALLPLADEAVCDYASLSILSRENKMLSPRVEKLIAGMTLEQKVGQMVCLGFSGVYPYPDIVEMVEKYHIGGYRVTPHGRKFARYFSGDTPAGARVTRAPQYNERVFSTDLMSPRITGRQWGQTANLLRKRSLETGAGIPLYFVLDYEGGQSADLLVPGLSVFPHAMGLAASGDSSLCRRVARANARQLKALGIDAIHSPVLDVNTHPDNPEIGTRSYSPKTQDVIKYAAESLAGFTEGGVWATAKHFPGRGHSTADVHFGVATIDESAERMRDIHLAPYRALIAQGLPSIMLAHSVFPGIDPDKEIATLSRAIITDVLRGELGFDGMVMTDSFTMGGLVAKYEVNEAAIMCIQHGVDLILLKDETALRGELFDGLTAAVRSGRITEDRLHNAVGHVLSLKERFGLLDGAKGMVDLDKVQSTLDEPVNAQVQVEAAQKSVVVLRDEANLLPLKPGQRVLVVEQLAPIMRRQNDEFAHIGALHQRLLENGVDAIYGEFVYGKLDDVWSKIQQRAAQVDLVIHTGFYERGKDPRRSHDQFLTLGKPTIFVTNSCYNEIVSPKMQTVVVTFAAWNPSLQAAADVIAGKLKATAKLDFDPTKVY